MAVMRNIITRLLLVLLIIAVYFASFTDKPEEIAGILLVIITSLLFTLLENKRTAAKSILWLCTGVIALRSNIFAIFLPLFIYDATLDLLPLYDRSTFTFAGKTPLLFAARPSQGWQNIFFYSPYLLLVPLIVNFSPRLLILAIIGGAFAYYSHQTTELRAETHAVRDSLEGKLLSANTSLKEMRLEEEQQHHITRLDERDRISRELHDVTGHTLSSALLQVGALTVLNTDPKLTPQLEQLHATLDSGMSEIRDTLHNLAADACDLELELGKLLEKASSFTTKLNVQGNNPLPLKLKLDILALAREAVTNTMKHSNGTKIQISLINRPTLISLSIRDNGTHTDNRDIAEGLGIRNMKSIVERNKGLFTINRNPGTGFTVHVVFFCEEF